MKLALAMIVKGTDEEALLLKNCLEDLAPVVDGIFITRTHKKGEKPNHAVGNVAAQFHAKLSTFEWVDDFAAARNFNFAQVPKDYDYIMWTDADDRWRGLEKLRDTLAEHPHTDAFGFWYLYDWDEFKKPLAVHRKTMIVKNDGAVSWAGALHEDFQENRQLEVQLVEGIERLHMTTNERAEENAKRNVAIAKKDLVANPDDPRSYFNLGNSQFGVSDYVGARETFTQFLMATHSDTEKYLAHQRLADVYRSLGDRESSVQQLQLAIGLAPMLPDAYLQLGHLFFSYGDLEKAEQYVLQGLVKRPMVHKLIVFNPRDYDYNPMMLLARIYYQKNRPDLMLPLLKGCLKIYPNDEHLKKMVSDGELETKSLEKALTRIQELIKIKSPTKLKAAIDRLPPDMRSHPAVAAMRNTHFVKKESSGKDLVIYCGNTTHQWNPELFKTKGFGGSEEAVVNMAREFAKLGWNVEVYNNCGHKEMTSEGVTYKPFWMWNYRDKQDVVILWRWMKPLDADINAPVVIADIHDVVPEGEFTEKRLAKVTKIMVKTQFHRSLYPNIPDAKIAVVPNGMDFATLTGYKGKRDPYLLINTSSPDRSLDVLPALFKRVKERVPNARMQWAYGWEIYKNTYAGDPKMMRWMEETDAAMKDAGIEILGRLTQAEVGQLYQKAQIFAYPTEFAEIDCISVKKAQAGGCVAVTTDFGALEESNQFGTKVHSPKTKDNWNRPYQFHFGLEDKQAQEEWVAAVCKALESKKSKMQDKKVAEWAKQFEWSAIAERWNIVLAQGSKIAL